MRLGFLFALTIGLGLAFALAVVWMGVQGAQGAPPRSGPYVKQEYPIPDPTPCSSSIPSPSAAPGTVVDVAMTERQWRFVASSVSASGSPTGELTLVSSGTYDNVYYCPEEVTRPFTTPVIGVAGTIAGTSASPSPVAYAVTSDATTSGYLNVLRYSGTPESTSAPSPSPVASFGTGSTWSSVAINTNTSATTADDIIYVTSQNDKKVFTFDSVGVTTANITDPTTKTPYALAVNESDDSLYLLSGDGSTAYVTRLPGGTLTGATTVTVAGLTPGRRALAVNPVTGVVYIGGAEAGVGVIRSYSNLLVAGTTATMTGYASIDGLVASTDGRRLYASTQGDSSTGKVHVLNTADFTETASVTVENSGPLSTSTQGWVVTGSPATSATRKLTEIGTAPTFTSITPASGSTAGGFTATITGKWFTASTIAALESESRTATIIGVPSSTSMTVTMPALSAGVARVILTTVAGFSQPLGINDSGSFTYVAPTPAPQAPATSTTSSASPSPTATPTPTPTASPTVSATATPSAPSMTVTRLRWPVSLVSGDRVLVTPPVRPARPVEPRWSQAPVVRSEVGYVTRIGVTGLPRRERVLVDMRIRGLWSRLGASRTGPRGGTTLPAFITARPGEFPIRMSAEGSPPLYLRVIASRPNG